MQNGELWMEFHDLGLERCGFASRIRCRKPLVRAVAGCRDIHKTAETPDTAGPHLGLHSHHKETPHLPGLKAPRNANPTVVVSCQSDKKWARYGVCSHPYMLPYPKILLFLGLRPPGGKGRQDAYWAQHGYQKRLRKRREAPASAGSAGSAKSAENILPTYSTPEITQPHVMSGTYVAVLRSKTCEPAEKAMT